jgi:hypothetical protein
LTGPNFVQAYNAQIAVDGKAQVIVAAEITQESNDKRQLAPMLERVEQNMGAKPEAATADAGYFSEEQLADKRVEGIELYVASEPVSAFGQVTTVRLRILQRRRHSWHRGKRKRGNSSGKSIATWGGRRRRRSQEIEPRRSSAFGLSYQRRSMKSEGGRPTPYANPNRLFTEAGSIGP